MHKARILLVDNNPEHLEAKMEILKRRGYEVVTAETPKKAKALLDEEWFHLAIIDIRLINDHDTADVSGLNLIKETDPIVPKIVLTAYPTWEATREALGTLVDGLPAAVDFVWKWGDPDKLIQSVARALQERVNINWDLKIQLERGLSFLHFVSLAEPDLADAQHLRRAKEFEDLFRKLFRDQTEVAIYAHPQEFEGAFFICARTKYKVTEQAEEIVVGWSKRSIFKQKKGVYKECVSEFARVQAASEFAFAETTHYAAEAYSLVGGPTEKPTEIPSWLKQINGGGTGLPSS
jgi:CheY-like chemotaxis protein